MRPDEIDAMIAAARASLLRAFTGFLHERGLADLRRSCFPIFQVHVKKRRFLLQVGCNEALTPADGVVLEESARGSRFVRVDPESGERQVVLSITPRAFAVFQAHVSFAAPGEVVVESTGDVAELRRVFAAGRLAVNQVWREELGAG